MESPVDPIQIQLLLDSYRGQLEFFKWAAGVVIAAETTAIVFLLKKLLECTQQIVMEIKGSKTTRRKEVP